MKISVISVVLMRGGAFLLIYFIVVFIGVDERDNLIWMKNILLIDLFG